jgi:hypothetical protein
MLDNLATFLHTHGRRGLLVAVLGATIAPKRSIHTQESTT